jgi:hypothetical protein
MALPERRLCGELRQQVREVRQSLRERRDPVDRDSLDRHLRRLDPRARDRRELVTPHAGHTHLDERPLHRPVLPDQVVDRVGDADQHECRRDDPVGQRFDRVGEERPARRTVEPVEFVEEDRERARPGKCLEAAYHRMRRGAGVAQDHARRLGNVGAARREPDAA